ncbi:MAG TPA: IlvD/Edd family dehydratase [Acidobacteriota bacterium]|nr:IlvD/Edd family dehydratase [Acidobacteriota bacterium]
MKLRSRSWFEGVSLYSFVHRSWLKSEGFPRDVFDGKPVIGICNSWSETANCNAHLRQVAEAVKRGVWEAGGFPLEFPTISLAETLLKPTAMLYRNLMAMDVEEMISGNPLDGVVLLCGCDKTTPAQLMGAASADLPAIMVPGGPMLSGRWKDQEIGSGTDVFRFWDLCRAGRMSEEEYVEIESSMSRSAGHCMVMGTASTMTSLAEVLGMTLPSCANIPAADSRRMAIAQESGRRAVDLVKEDLRPSQILTKEAFQNAIRVCMAMGGSTNAVIHLCAIAGRLDIQLSLDEFDRISRETPMLVNVKPSGEYLMEDLFYAGGVPALMNEIQESLHTDAITVTGRSIGENIAAAKIHNLDVIRPTSNPLNPEGGIAVLKGNLAPAGALLKQTAATPELLVHSGPAVVFENREDLLSRIDSPELEVTAESVLVLRNAGPKGAPGMPEWGQLPIPKKLLEQGVEDMVRLSDARMSGTSYGTVVLHVAPESAEGGPLAIVRDGDIVELNVPERRLHLQVSNEEIAARLEEWKPPKPHYRSGYGRLFLDHVSQAPDGCDFDFLEGKRTEDDLPARYARMGHS